jgi:hypothetical protein
MAIDLNKQKCFDNRNYELNSSESDKSIFTQNISQILRGVNSKILNKKDK